MGPVHRHHPRRHQTVFEERKTGASYFRRFRLQDGDTGEEKNLASARLSGLSTVIPSGYILKLVTNLPDINESRTVANFSGLFLDRQGLGPILN